ncbi:MAG: flavodoxin-dependent (E)-4-hydroxy-3-methylbut-2-enyl-diphosphate synthase, partial [Oscillospiraceae bacterium]
MKTTKTVKIGNVKIGGGQPVLVQSMTNVPTSDIEKTVAQIIDLENAGCDIVRASIPDVASAKAIKTIKENTHIPLVADIHFDYRLALIAMECGIDKVRINPGNIGGEDNAKAVAVMAKAKNIPIRIGVNGGSLENGILEKCGGNLAKAMVESAKRHVEILNRYDFDDIVLSMKSSSVKTTIEAYRLAAEAFEYPLHLGVTEAGTMKMGMIKSSIGIGSLLADGIGDTIRVSLTDDPIHEVSVARQILRALDLGGDCVEVVSCPTCA